MLISTMDNFFEALSIYAILLETALLFIIFCSVVWAVCMLYEAAVRSIEQMVRQQVLRSILREYAIQRRMGKMVFVFVFLIFLIPVSVCRTAWAEPADPALHYVKSGTEEEKYYCKEAILEEDDMNIFLKNPETNQAVESFPKDKATRETIYYVKMLVGKRVGYSCGDNNIQKDGPTQPHIRCLFWEIP